MITSASNLVRRKPGGLAMMAFALFVITGPGHQQDAQKATGPWPIESGLAVRLERAASSAADYATGQMIGDRDRNPFRMGEQTVQRFDRTSEGYKSADAG